MCQHYWSPTFFKIFSCRHEKHSAKIIFSPSHKEVGGVQHTRKVSGCLEQQAQPNKITIASNESYKFLVHNFKNVLQKCDEICENNALRKSHSLQLKDTECQANFFKSHLATLTNKWLHLISHQRYFVAGLNFFNQHENNNNIFL